MPNEAFIWDTFQTYDFNGPLLGGKSTQRTVFVKGEGPPLLIMHELPGLSPQTFELAEKYISAGFSVHLPLLLGKTGANDLSRWALASQTFQILCMNSEIRALRRRGTSPITVWLRALCNHIRDQSRYDGVGVIGMCLTGNFAITLMADSSVLGSVSAQPSLPFCSSKALHMADTDIRDIKSRLDSLNHKILGFRFERDKICKQAKFLELDRQLNSLGRTRIELETLKNIEAEAPLHSVLVYSFADGGAKTQAVLDKTIEYFRNSFELES